MLTQTDPSKRQSLETVLQALNLKESLISINPLSVNQETALSFS